MAEYLRKKSHEVPAAMFYMMTVSAVPLAVYGLLHAVGVYAVANLARFTPF